MGEDYKIPAFLFLPWKTLLSFELMSTFSSLSKANILCASPGTRMEWLAYRKKVSVNLCSLRFMRRWSQWSTHSAEASWTSFILFSCGSKWTQNQPKSRLLAKKEGQITHFSVIYEVKWTVWAMSGKKLSSKAVNWKKVRNWESSQFQALSFKRWGFLSFQSRPLVCRLSCWVRKPSERFHSLIFYHQWDCK